MNDSASAMEVEVRGPLSEEETPKLLERLGREGQYEGLRDRFFINFTDDRMRARGLDLRVRMTNGRTEIVAKSGKWLGEIRTETILDLGEGQFQTAVALFAALGITQGVACRRLIHQYRIDDISLSVIEVPGHSWFYEAEETCSAKEQARCRSRILERLDSLGLRSFSEEGFVAYVAELDVKANERFDSREQRLESLELYPMGDSSR